MGGAALTTLALIYHMTVYKIRKGDRNAVFGLAMSVVKSLLMVAILYLMFYFLQMRSSPIRGNFILYIMSGIFLFLTQNKAMGAVLGADGPVSPLMKHGPLNPSIAIVSSALAALFQQTFACLTLLLLTHALIEPVKLEHPFICLGIFLLAWFTGCCIGLMFRAAKPWWPGGITIISQFYMRANMFTSGKIFVANALPSTMLPLFTWNPLFHTIDQARGFAFVNYTPRNSDLLYPISVALTFLMIGLVWDFVNRHYISLSWSVRRL